MHDLDLRPPRYARSGALAGALVSIGLGACGDGARETPPPDDTTCAPTCGERTCGPDGCGGTCGTCDAGALCTIDGVCVDVGGPDDCDRSCDELGYACGEHCGVSCGVCTGADEACVGHACVCQPRCGAATCEEADGCGGTCPACEVTITCSDCALRLVVVDAQLTGGATPLVREVTVALDFQPPTGAPLPGMADLRFALTGPATITGVALGESLISAEKGFYTDPETGHPYRELPDGTLQLLVLSTSNTRTIPAGRWLFLTLTLAPPDAGRGFTPMQLGLVEREEVLAPAPADAVLWGSRYGEPIVVWPDALEVSHAP